jgi:hypothetical protein
MPQLGAALQGRIVPTNNRYRAGVLQSALQKSRIDRATTPLGPPRSENWS